MEEVEVAKRLHAVDAAVASYELKGFEDVLESLLVINVRGARVRTQ